MRILGNYVCELIYILFIFFLLNWKEKIMKKKKVLEENNNGFGF